ncbi:hypothetical protein B0H14DRAFT_3154279 [Mycena olivaceomarginata]|nr:hypothetical protein B0H14DRAFT_3154279 [Mycena olivaceomarginata]
MAPKLRARLQAISDTESTHSGQDRASESEEDPTGRPKRASKATPRRTKSGPERLLLAPSQRFPKIVWTQSQSRSRQENEPHPAPSSQLESKCQKSEATMDDSNDDDMALMHHPPPKKHESHRRPSATRGVVVDSNHDASPEIVPTQPQPSEKTRGRPRAAAAPIPVHVHAEDAGFADEEDDHSDPEMGAADEEDEPVEEADDLQGLGADEVERRLADSVLLWSSSNTDDEDSAMLSRPSSRASFSSGHYSVPESNFDPNEVSSDSDSSDSDPAMCGAFSGLKAARECLPAPVKTTVTSRHERQQPAKASSAPSAPKPETTSKAGPHQPVGKREAKRAQERPEWNDPRPSVSRASGQRSRSRHPSITIKHEYAEPVHIKAEPEDSTLTSTGGSDDINLRKNRRGTLNLTKQHPDVQNVLGLAIDYFLGFYLLKCAYPDLRVKTTFYQDALTWSARDLKLPLLQTRLREDADYRSGLSTVLFGRISIWRSKVKTAAHQVVYGHYQVQHDCAGLKMDPRTHEVTHGKPDKRRPYEHKGVPAVASCFFKGPNSIAERVEAMFVRNAAGNLETSQSMVTLSCAGIFSTVDDYSTGEHKPTDFEGSRVQDVYEVHIMILQKLEAEHPEQYHYEYFMYSFFSSIGNQIFNLAERLSLFEVFLAAYSNEFRNEGLFNRSFTFHCIAFRSTVKHVNHAKLLHYFPLLTSGDVRTCDGEQNASPAHGGVARNDWHRGDVGMRRSQ